MKLRTLASLALSMALFTPATGVLAQDADIPAWQQVRNVPHGVVQRLEYQSTSIDKAREALVYLPPGYDGGTDRYPVLYLSLDNDAMRMLIEMRPQVSDEPFETMVTGSWTRSAD